MQQTPADRVPQQDAGDKCVLPRRACGKGRSQQAARLPGRSDLRRRSFVNSTIHFGIYLILGAGKALVERRILARLRQFSRSDLRVRRLLVFAG